MSVDSDRHGAWKDGETRHSQVVEQRYVSRGGQRPAADESTSLSFHASTAEPRCFRTPILPCCDLRPNRVSTVCNYS